MLPQYLLALFLSSINQIQQQPEKHQKKSSIVDISSWKTPKILLRSNRRKIFAGLID